MSSLLTTSLIVIFLGPPGAGKGTHAGPLSDHLGIPHISTGDLFRSHIRETTPLGKIANGYISEGKLVPDELVLDMLFERLSRQDCGKGCILDGFPRTVLQAEAFDRRLQACGSSQLSVLYFRIDDALLIQRITGRLSCKQCSTPYQMTFQPPQKPGVCDRCEGALYQRDDDREEIVRKRLEVYRLQTQPVIEFYAQKPGALQEICAAGSPQGVFDQVVKALSFLPEA